MVRTLGTKVEAPTQAIVRLPDGEYTFSRTIPALDVPAASINPRNYAMIHDLRIEEGVASYNSDSAILMVQGFNDKEYGPAHVAVLKSGLAVPTPARFMPHLRNVNYALERKGVLYDACGNLIDGDRLEKYAHTVNHNCWAWLNAGFPVGEGFLGLNLVSVTGIDDKDNPTESSVPLEDCLENDCWADLDSLNPQGFPTKKAPIDKYEPGKTFYFRKPVKNSVARVDANPDGLNLSCDWVSLYRDSSLGVFPVFNAGSLARKQD